MQWRVYFATLGENEWVFKIGWEIGAGKHPGLTG